MRRFEEAWWCCLHHGGLALVQYARHAATLRENAIHVNLLVPGTYRLALPGGREAEVRISTEYPARSEAVLSATAVPEGVSLRLRVPGCVRRPAVTALHASCRKNLILRILLLTTTTGAAILLSPWKWNRRFRMQRAGSNGYHQIGAVLGREWLRGTWQAGRQCPSHAELQRRFQTTEVTIQRAMHVLAGTVQYFL